LFLAGHVEKHAFIARDDWCSGLAVRTLIKGYTRRGGEGCKLTISRETHIKYMHRKPPVRFGWFPNSYFGIESLPLFAVWVSDKLRFTSVFSSALLHITMIILL